MQKYFCPLPIGFNSDHPHPLLFIMPLKVVGTGFDGFSHNLYLRLFLCATYLIQ